MRCALSLVALSGLVFAGSALAGGGNPDFRIKAGFKTPKNGAWGQNESVGGADFRIVSRFSQVYYGGVSRSDDFKFSVQLDFTAISSFSTQYAVSPYDTNYDVYINNSFVGRVFMNTPMLGFGELAYQSRHATPPELPLPADFPDHVNVGDVVRAFAAASTLPNIGDPLPGGAPMFQSALEEKFARGDVNQDGKVNILDFPFLAANYDPYHMLGAHVGPANGDFTGGNTADLADYQLFVANWNGSGSPPAEPAPVVTPCTKIDFNHDGFVTGDDFDAYVAAFEAGAMTSDFDSDGFVTGDDFDGYVAAFEAGC